MNKKTIESRITDVTVFLGGAQVTRTAKVKIPAGVSELTVDRLPYIITERSLQVYADKAAVLSAEFQIDHLRDAADSKETESLKTRLKELEKSMLYVRNDLDLCDKETEFFKSNMSVAGRESGLKVAELKAAAEFFSERMRALGASRLEAEEKLENLKNEAEKIKSQLGRHSELRTLPVGTVTIKVSSEKEQQIELNISYALPNASWQPLYDIRAKDTRSDILLQFNAKITQNTGEDWEDVRLTVSTGNLREGSDLPVIRPEYIDFFVERPRPMMRKAVMACAAPISADAESMCEEVDVADMAMPGMNAFSNATVSRSLTASDYVIKAPFSAASGDGGQTVDIICYPLSAKFGYYSISKLRREVFLTAVIKDWKQLNIVDGEASIFYENRFIGKTRIDPRTGDDELSLSLGTDSSVMVIRERGRDFSEKTFIGSSTRASRQFELTVRNLKTEPIDITVIDQIPVSVNKQISVDPVEISSASLDAETGILTWEFTLDAGQTKKLPFKYTVTYPKNTIVPLD